MMRRAIAGLGLTVLAACEASPTRPAARGPQAEISDAAHAGRAHFNFLPPLVPDPETAGTFDGSISPTVEICVWNGTDCDMTLALFNDRSGPGSETVRVDNDEELYIVNWHTDDILLSYPIDPAAGESYRIRVLVGDILLGYADVQVASSGRELRNVDTNEFIPLKDGRTLPIKFRIEEGFDGEVVSAGVLHSCAVTLSNDAYCWGRNRYGELGTGSLSPGFVTTPQLVVGGHKFREVTPGIRHSCGITLTDDAYCWGYNVFGALGTGTTSVSEPTPVPVGGGHKWKSVTPSHLHTCGVTEAGEGLCWGAGSTGQLGTGGFPVLRSLPTPVNLPGTFEAISTGFVHSCGLLTTGDAYCWGGNYRGQLGLGATSFKEELPRPVVGGHVFQTIAAGWNNSCGVTTTGEARCWGRNSHGQMGDGTTTPPPWARAVPTLVSGGHTFASIDVGWLHNCALTPGGDAHCWGANSLGELGIGAFTAMETVPVMVSGGLSFRTLTAGAGHTCGTASDGQGYCWGENDFGQLGDGTLIEKAVPTRVNLAAP